MPMLRLLRFASRSRSFIIASSDAFFFPPLPASFPLARPQFIDEFLNEPRYLAARIGDRNLAILADLQSPRATSPTTSHPTPECCKPASSGDERNA